jgi:CRP/FNR family transcriptional regulator, cyclic AMP receptor protein
MQKYISHATPTPSPYGLAIPDSCVTCSLRNEGLFCSLPLPVLRDFDKLRASTVLPKNAVLFVEGEAPRGMYIVCQGEVKLSTTSLDRRPVILKLAHPAEILGLTACVSGLPYALTAETRTPCHMSFVRREEFLRFLRRHGQACLQAAKHLSARRRDASETVRGLALGHVANEKFAKFLLGLDEEGNNRLTLTMTHEEIGEVLGVSRETVTRAFTDFKRAKWIGVNGKVISIHDRKALERLLAA